MSKGKNKRFLTYVEQEDNLNSKGVSCYNKDERVMIRRLGYFNLVSGYKWPFVSGKDKNGSYLYAKGTTVEQMVRVKSFDDELRMLLLRYITGAEDEVRSIVAYKFDDVNLEILGEVTMYDDIRSYDVSFPIKDIKRLTARISRELSFSRVSYLNEYRKKYERVPSWLMFKFIGFSTFVTLLGFVRVKVRDDICNLYDIVGENGVVDHDLLIDALHWLRKVRNVCAHNERVYDAKAKSRIIERYFKMMPSEYLRSNEDKKIVDLLVYLKYFLDANDYAGLIGQLSAMLRRLEGELIPKAFATILNDMGIVRQDDLEMLLREKRVSDYLML